MRYLVRLTVALAMGLSVSLATSVVPDLSKKKGAGPWFRIHRDGKWGYMDRAGSTVIAPRFSDARDFFHGLAAVKQDDKWGYIDQKGTVVIEAAYDDARDFLETLAPVRVGRKWGYIDTRGAMTISPQFQAGAEFHEGLARVYVWSKVQCREGAFSAETAPSPRYLFRLPEEMLPYYTSCHIEDGKFGFVDHRGKYVIPPRHRWAADFSEGLAVVCVKPGRSLRCGYIDRGGDFAIPPRFLWSEVLL